MSQVIAELRVPTRMLGFARWLQIPRGEMPEMPLFQRVTTAEFPDTLDYPDLHKNPNAAILTI